MKKIKSGYQFTTGWHRDLTPEDIVVLEEEIEKGTAEVRLLPGQEWVGGESVTIHWHESKFSVKPDAPDPHEES